MLNDGNKGQFGRLLGAMIVSALIIIGFNIAGARLFGLHTPEKPAAAAGKKAADGGSGAAAAVVPSGNIASTVDAGMGVPLENDLMRAQVDLTGGRIDGMVLKPFKNEIDDPQGYTLLKPSGDHAEFVAAGWLGAGVEGPGETSHWQLEGDLNGPGKPVVMVWRNTTGQAFERTISLRPGSYMVDVTDEVVNTATLPVTLSPYVQVHLADGPLPDERSSWINYSGPMGVVEQQGEPRSFDKSFSSLKKHGDSDIVSGKGGWWGMTSQYFIAAVLPDATPAAPAGDASATVVDGASQRTFRHASVTGPDGKAHDVYSASVRWPDVVVPAGGSRVLHYSLYTGPKHAPVLKAADHHLDMAITWGWFAPLVKGFYAALVWLHSWLGNWALSVMALTLALKLLTFPLANKSYHSMAKMRKLQPEIAKLKERNKGDQQQLAMATMQLYQKHKVNPMSGCWPMVIQIPIFFAMYKVVLLMFEFRHAALGPGILGQWVPDMSVHDPLYILPILMGVSMFLQFRLNPTPPDPTQAEIFKWMPVVFTFLFLHFPAGLVLYWLTNNVLSIAQQWFIMKEDRAI